MIFIFDYHGDRGFYMELSEMLLGENLSKATCTKKQGKAPAQFLKEQEVEPVKPVIIAPIPLIELEDDEDEDENEEDTFYGTDDYNPDELDMEGYEGLDEPDTDTDVNIEEDAELE